MEHAGVDGSPLVLALPVWDGRADVIELVLGDPISRFRTRKHRKCGGDKEIQKVWRCGRWALAGGTGFRQAGRNQPLAGLLEAVVTQDWPARVELPEVIERARVLGH